MTQPSQDPDLAALAEASTSGGVLYEIATRRHGLAPFVAQHPNKYPELLEWLTIRPAVELDPDGGYGESFLPTHGVDFILNIRGTTLLGQEVSSE